MKMMESMKYVEVLVEVGASIASVSEEWPNRMEGVPPVVEVREDWHGSYDEICKYKRMLDGLDYNAMFVESRQQNAKEIITEWRSSRHNFLGVDYLLENGRLYYQHMEKVCGIIKTEKLKKNIGNDESRGSLRNEAIRLWQRGKWSQNEMQLYSHACSEVFALWYRRSRELLGCYDFSVNLESPTNQIERPKRIIEMFCLAAYADEFFSGEGMAKKNASQWGRRAAQFVRKKKLNIGEGDKVKLWRQIMAEYPEMKESGYDVFRQQLPPVR